MKIAEAEQQGGNTLIDESGFQKQLAGTEIAISAMEFTELIPSQLSAGKNVGPESSLLKCRGTELQQHHELVKKRPATTRCRLIILAQRLVRMSYLLGQITPMLQHPNISIPERCRSTPVQTKPAEHYAKMVLAVIPTLSDVIIERETSYRPLPFFVSLR